MRIPFPPAPSYLLPMHPANIPVTSALRYQRIDLWVRDTAHQAVAFEPHHRIATHLLAQIEADTPPSPAPTVYHSTYGPVEGYMLQVSFMHHSPVPYYPTLQLVVDLRAPEQLRPQADGREPAA